MKKGRAYNSGSFLFKTLETKSEKDGEIQPTNLKGSFLASKKVFSKAVDRNRAKRRIKEVFVEAVGELNKETQDRKQATFIPSFVFLTKIEIIKCDFANIVQEIKQILVKDYIIQ